MRQFNANQSKLLADLVIPVELHFGKLQLTAQELLELSDGQIFPIYLQEESNVSLLVAGEVFAEGKLIKDDSAIYVEITQVFSDSWETNSNVSPIQIQTDTKEENNE
jgi:flagellar motor switch/type III secretory pathway protein FliN